MLFFLLFYKAMITQRLFAFKKQETNNITYSFERNLEFKFIPRYLVLFF